MRRAWILPCLLVTLAELCSCAAWAGEVVAITIDGLDEKLEENVRHSLTLARSQAGQGLSPAWVKLAHARAAAEIRGALEPFGFYRAVVDGSLTSRDGVWFAKYRIFKGPELLLKRVEVRIDGEGRSFAPLTRLAAEFPLKVGERLIQPKYDGHRSRLEAAALESGFLDARFTRREIRIDLEKYQAEIELVLDTGVRHRFGNIHFEEQDALGVPMLQRFLPFKPGDPYNNADLLELQKALSESGYFSRVDVEPQMAEIKQRRVPIRVGLTPLSRHRYQAGVGYGTDTGPRVNFAYQNRFLNEKGHQFRANLRLSLIQQLLDAAYIIPLKNPRVDQFSINAVASRQDNRAGRAETVRFGVRLSGPRFGWRETLALDYLYENFDVDEQSRQANLLIPGANWSYLKADDKLYTRRGFRVDFGVSAASHWLLSNNAFVQVKLGGKGIISPSENGRIIARGQLGLTRVDDFDNLPLTLRFYAGGDNSVRGYAFNSISPRDRNGNETGGRYQTVGSLEYEHMLYGPWGAAVFYDVGRISNSFGGAFKQGVGAGVRWRSPVGMVRLDVATAISEPDFPIHVHFVLGSDL